MDSAAPVTLDGAHGEGGGQIVRAALALATVAGRPVRIVRIRAARPRPGLQPQHLTVVRALAAISGAAVTGDALGSTAVTFAPRAVQPGEYRFDVGALTGSAGSVTLLFEALLLPLALAAGPSRLTLVGGTHVPWSPPAHNLTDVFLPALAPAGVDVRLRLVRWGFYPAGGGEVVAEIQPGGPLAGLALDTPPAGPPAGLSAVSRLPRAIAERQRRRVEARLEEAGETAGVAIVEDATARSPGTVVFLAARGRAGCSALGRRGVPAERVADEAVDAWLAFRASGAAIDEHLADQLLPFLAVARGESVLTCPAITSHLATVAWVAGQLLPVAVTLAEGRPARVHVRPAAPGRV
jgi:RNA 3'-terminal phosphate cyclase (ATP)